MSTRTTTQPSSVLNMRTNNTNNKNSDDEDPLMAFGPHIPEDKVQHYVQTPYGRGLTIRSQKNVASSATAKYPFVMREIQLVDWKHAAAADNNNKNKKPSRPATLYSPQAFPSVAPQVGDDVVCLYGRGRVREIRRDDDNNNNNNNSNGPVVAVQVVVVVVELSSWRLAGRSNNKVVCYMQPSQLQVVRPKRVYEMSIPERLDYARAGKRRAHQLFADKHYQKALEEYQQAADALRYIQHAHAVQQQHSVDIRAHVWFLLVTCSNNAANCSAHLQRWEQVATLAQQAHVLLQALYERTTSTNSTTAELSSSSSSQQQQQQQQAKIPKAVSTLVVGGAASLSSSPSTSTTTTTTTSQIVALLVREGHSESQLFGEFRVKSLLLQARAKAHTGDPTAALQLLQEAHKIVAHYNKTTSAVLTSLAKEIQRLHTACKERQKRVRLKEKQRAQAMFGNNKKNNKTTSNTATAAAAEAAVNSSSTSSSTSTTTATTQQAPSESTFSALSPNNNKDPSSSSPSSSTLPWYEDSEFVVGLSVFAGAAVVAAVTTALWIGGGRPK